MGVIDPARRAQQFGENGAGLLFALCDDLGTTLPSLPAPDRFMGALTVATGLNRSPLFSQYLACGEKRPGWIWTNEPRISLGKNTRCFHADPADPAAQQHARRVQLSGYA